MLNSVFGILETTEVQLTSSAIKRLRVTSVLSFFAFPLFAAAELLAPNETVKTTLIVLGAICFVALLYCSFTRMANRLWVPEKYLDEAEIHRKRRSGSLTYQIMLGVLTVLAIIGILIGVQDLEATWNARAVFYGIASFFIGALSVQTAIAAFMTEPLSEGTVQKVPSDARYKWFVILFLLIAAVLGYVLN